MKSEAFPSDSFNPMSYPGIHAATNPDKTAVVMARTGESLSYQELEDRSCRFAQMMREAGALEVHMRIASPPIKYPDFYGIDTPVQDQLLAANQTLEKIDKYFE